MTMTNRWIFGTVPEIVKQRIKRKGWLRDEDTVTSLDRFLSTTAAICDMNVTIRGENGKYLDLELSLVPDVNDDGYLTEIRPLKEEIEEVSTGIGGYGTNYIRSVNRERVIAAVLDAAFIIDQYIIYLKPKRDNDKTSGKI